MTDKKTVIIFGTIIVIFGLPLVSVYILNGFENSEHSLNTEIATMGTIELNTFDEFVEILTEIDESLMSFFADFRETHLT